MEKSKKEVVVKKMSSFNRHMKAEMEAHKRIGSMPAHVRSSKENKKFYRNLQKGK